MSAERPAIQIYPYQQKWLRDTSRFKIGMFARQTGKTFTTTLDIVDDCYEDWTAGRSKDWLILSRGERQAKEAMQQGVVKHAKAYGLSLELLEDEFKGDSGTTYKQMETILPNGSSIIALPANPDTARGYSRNVFLDEFAWHKDSRAIWGALFPVISAGFKLRITSTPNGKKNKFYELMTGKDNLWSRHSCDIYEAVNDGLVRNIDEMKIAMGDEELWQQEFEIQWLDEASAWLSYDLINSCEDDLAGIPSGFGGGSTFVGNDIARRRHLWIAWVLEMVGDVAWTRDIRALRNESFAVQDQEMDDVFERYRPTRIGMDQTGMGEKPVEDAQRRYGAMTVEGALLTPARRLDLATAMKRRFEDRTLRIPAGNQDIRDDLHSVKRMAGPTGAPRLVIDDDDLRSHADYFWALALACGVAVGGPAEYGYRPVGNQADDVDAEGLPDDDDVPGGWGPFGSQMSMRTGTYG